MNVALSDDLGALREVDELTERAIIEMVRLLIRQKPAVRDVEHWDRGWSENYYAYSDTGDLGALRPKYIRKGLPLRMNGRFVLAEDPDYEWKWYRRFLARVADDWLKDAGYIVELGCGSAHNVAWLSDRFPDKLIVGTDWSKASLMIIEDMRRRGRSNVEGKRFDFYHPSAWGDLTCGIVLTVGAMEQTGKKWRPMLEWFLARRPRRIVHVEPQVNMYDPNNPVDQTAIEAHYARNFWTGYWEALVDLEKAGKIEIEEAERTGFGSLLCEGYSLVVFKVL